MKRLRIYRFGFSCPDAPHVTRARFYLTLCLGRIQIMWRRR